MGYDFTKKFMDKFAMKEYRAKDSAIGKKYGPVVRAIELSNREYQHRYDRLNTSRNMKAPPISGRIFPGYLVVRNFGTPEEYETWIPDGGFEESHELIE